MLDKEQQTALDEWAGQSHDRAVIEEFLDWWPSHGGHWCATMPLTDSLDRFFGIDRKKLEQARRQLLSDYLAQQAESTNHT